jgi:hypothetical protein
MTRGSEAMTWRGATSFGTGMTRGSEAMTWHDDVDRKKGIRNLERKRETGIKARGNRELKCFWGSVLGVGCRGEAFLGSVFGKGIAWRIVRLQIGGSAFLGSVFRNGIARRIVGLRIGEEDTYGQGTRWNGVGTVLDWAVLEPGVGGVGTGGGRCWNRRWAVLEPEVGVLEPDIVVEKSLNASIDEIAFKVGTNRCHKGEVFRL